jgi:prepilin-type N-terminal cleavage/methylation domain-containing protein
MKPNSTKKHHRIYGFTLVEFAIVLGIIGVILSGIWAMASNVNNNIKLENFSTMLTTIVGNIRGHYVGRASFDDPGSALMSMDTLRNLNVFPGNMVRATGIARVDTPFALNSLQVCEWALTGQTSCAGAVTGSPLFAIEVLLSRKDCIGAVLRNSNPATLPGLIAVYINNDIQGMPLNSSTVDGACNLSGPATKITVDFVFRLTP